MPKATEHDLSVWALINDLKHVVSELEPAVWASTSCDVREHHTPPIASALLTTQMAEVQRKARETVDQITVLETDPSLWTASTIRSRVEHLESEYAKALEDPKPPTRQIFDLQGAQRAANPTFVPREPKQRRLMIPGLFSRRD